MLYIVEKLRQQKFQNAQKINEFDCEPKVMAKLRYDEFKELLPWKIQTFDWS